MTAAEGAPGADPGSGQPPSRRPDVRAGSAALLPVLVCILLAAVVGAVYRPSLHAPFVFDSVNNIAQNPSIRMTRVDLASLKRAAFPDKLNLRPLSFVTFALNYRVGGLETFGYRLVNLLILLATIPAAYWLGLVVAKPHLPAASARATALGATVIWSLHPLLTNGVTYVVQRMTSLSALLSVLALGAFCSAKPAGRPRRYAAAAVLWVLAIAAKETALLLPLLALAHLWLAAPAGSAASRRLGLALGGGVAASQAALLLFSSRIVRLGWVPELPFTLAQRALTEGRVVAEYLGLFFLPLPSRLNLDHSFALSTSLHSPPSTLPAFALHALLVGAALRLGRRRPVAGFSILAFYLLQLAEGTFLPVDLIFEHRLYFPAFFLALAVADLAAWALGAVAPRRSGAALLALALAAGACLATFTYRRNVLWSDPVALWRDVASKSPANPRAQLNYGSVLAERGRHAEALDVYRRLVALAPDYQLAHYNQGNSLAALGRYRPAIASYERAIRLRPDCAACYNNLGNAHFALGSYAEAQRSYALALEHEPGNHRARFNLGLSALRLGRREAALAAYRVLAGQEPALARSLLAEIR